MLKKVTITNFKSFKSTTEIDFQKKNYTLLPQNVAENDILKGAVFVGANASGKSNILLSIKFLLDMLFAEKNMSNNIWGCLFSTDPTIKLNYEFLINNKTIEYTIVLDRNIEVKDELLKVDDELVMQRMGLSAKYINSDEDTLTYNEESVVKSNLFLRTLYFNTKFAGNSILQNFMLFLKNSIYVYSSDAIIYTGASKFNIFEYLKENGCDEINALFEKYDFDQVIEYTNRAKGGNYTFFSKEDEKSIFFKKSGLDVPIPFLDESAGNRELIGFLPLLFHCLQNNSMLIIDEFSSGFHNVLEEFLVKHFMNNAKKSQMFFTTHSTNILSNSIMRPDQEYAVEFNSEIGSFVNRFSNEKPRTAQNIEKMYESGVFGGIPNYEG